MDIDLTLDGQQKALLEQFVTALKTAQSVQFVAIVKQGKDKAEYMTGGYKSAGPTLYDMAKSIGALAYDLTLSLKSHFKTKTGQDVTYEQAAQMIGKGIEEGLNGSFKAESGYQKIISLDGDDVPPQNGASVEPPKGPRGF